MTRTEFLQLLLGGGAAGYLSSAEATSAGHIPGPAFDFLNRWKQRPLIPTREPLQGSMGGGKHSPVAYLIQAVAEEKKIRITYHGGSEPGRSREVHPILVFARPTADVLREWVEQPEPPFSTPSKHPHDEPWRDTVISHLPPRKEELIWRDLTNFLETRAHIYLLAWCRLREKQRCFRVDTVDLG
ncbi:MAG: WYL domain-containing protein [Verrucomicrobiales bacterium]|nr:WYL domain-containing protein [Verrucomicrobiales bacterium]